MIRSFRQLHKEMARCAVGVALGALRASSRVGARVRTGALICLTLRRVQGALECGCCLHMCAQAWALIAFLCRAAVVRPTGVRTRAVGPSNVMATGPVTTRVRRSPRRNPRSLIRLSVLIAVRRAICAKIAQSWGDRCSCSRAFLGPAFVARLGRLSRLQLTRALE